MVDQREECLLADEERNMNLRLAKSGFFTMQKRAFWMCFGLKIDSSLQFFCGGEDFFYTRFNF